MNTFIKSGLLTCTRADEFFASSFTSSLPLFAFLVKRNFVILSSCDKSSAVSPLLFFILTSFWVLWGFVKRYFIAVKYLNFTNSCKIVLPFLSRFSIFSFCNSRFMTSFSEIMLPDFCELLALNVIFLELLYEFMTGILYNEG